MRRHRSVAALVPSLVLLITPEPRAGSQTEDTPEYDSWSVANQNAANRYEGLYGPPEFWTLDLIVGPDARHDVPTRQSIRTVGRLQVMQRPRQVPLVELCTEDIDHCLPLSTPVREISDAFFDAAPSRRDEMAEVVGVFGADEGTGLVPAQESPAPPEQRQSTAGGFLFWSFSSAPPFERAAKSRTVTLEDLVVDPGGYAGRTVVVRGVFRGRNLFDDMPGKSTRSRDDWVLKDGPCFVWVTGQPPKGDGFSLRLDDRTAQSYRLEVEGEPELYDGLVYLRASAVRLVGRERGDAEAPEE